MNDLIKEIKRLLNDVENEYNFYNQKIKSGNAAVDDNARRLYWAAQMNAYNNILNYYKQEL